MKKMKKLFAVIMAVLTGLFIQPAVLAEAGGSATVVTALSPVYDGADLDDSWSDAVSISLTGSSAVCSDPGVDIDGSEVKIEAGGVYAVSGALNGRLIVKAGETETVRLILDGASITSSDGAAISVKKTQKVILTLAEGSENTLTDSETYTFEEGEDEPNACLFSKCDLTINGSGALTVNARYAHGIVCKDNLIIAGGSLTVNAVSNGIRGRDSLTILGGAFDITAGNDGLQANNDEDGALGYVIIEDGDFRINSVCDAIQAETALQIDGGCFSLVTGGSSANASSSSNAGRAGGWGMWSAPTSSSDTASAKGLKAGVSVLLTGGTFDIDAYDDALHTNGSATIAGGTLNILSGDDGLHADDSLVIAGGEIAIEKSYEGLEASYVELREGTVRVASSDDGVNSSGGNDGSALGGRMGGFAQTNGYIRITGGHLYVNAEGDGLDSNGSLYIDGGTVLIDGPTNSGNGALDTNGAFTVTGGVLIAAGAAGMAEYPDSSSTQYCVAGTLPAQAAGTAFSVTDESGRTVLAYAPSKNYASVVFSLPALEGGATYTILTGGQISGESEDGYAADCTGGEQAATVTLDAAVTTFGTSGMMGGGKTGRMNGGSFAGEKPDMGGKPGWSGEPGMGGRSDAGSMPDAGTMPDMGDTKIT